MPSQRTWTGGRPREGAQRASGGPPAPLPQCRRRIILASSVADPAGRFRRARLRRVLSASIFARHSAAQAFAVLLQPATRERFPRDKVDATLTVTSRRLGFPRPLPKEAPPARNVAWRHKRRQRAPARAGLNADRGATARPPDRRRVQP